MALITFKNKNIKFTKSDLIGTWQLVDFFIQAPNLQLTSWGEACTGLLFYTNDNHMSVSINKNVESKSDIEEKNFFDSILFYSGTFKIESIKENSAELLDNPFTNSTFAIKHTVQQASDPHRIGKELLRYTGFDSNSENTYLTLSSPVESFGRGVIRWQKI
jgi:hypothetical protein